MRFGKFHRELSTQRVGFAGIFVVMQLHHHNAPSSRRKVYNGLGQLALLTTPGAKPGLDETQVVFGEGFAVVSAMLSFANLTKGDAARSN